MLNAIVVGLETDYGSEAYVPFEWFFFIFFTCEAAWRVRLQRCEYLSVPKTAFESFGAYMLVFSVWHLDCFSLGISVFSGHSAFGVLLLWL